MTDKKKTGGRKGRTAAPADLPAVVPEAAPAETTLPDLLPIPGAPDAWETGAADVYIGEVPVYCAHDRLVPVEAVVPNPRNPNTHPDRQIDLLARIIGAQGWRAPITISNRSGFIVRGHGRYLAALRLGLPSVPADFQDYPSEAAEWADLIADNRIAELAEMDMARLKEDLLALDDGSFDMELTGFDSGALEDLLTGEFGPPPPGTTIPTPPPQQEPTLQSDHLIEIRCTAAALGEIRPTLAEWGRLDGVIVSIS